MPRFSGRFVRSAAWTLRLILPLALGVCLLGLPGCAPTPDERAREQDAPVTLALWTLQLMTFADVIQPMIDGFERAHPGVRVQWTDVPFNEGEKRALTAILGNDPPDVINLNPDFSAILASRGALADIRTLTTETQRAQYLPAAWQAVTLSEKPSDGRAPMIFGVPWYLTSRVTLINRALLARAGWSRAPQTMPELLAFARDLKRRAPKAYALMPNIAAGGAFLKELQKNGVTLYDPQTSRATFADHGAATLLRQWRTLYAERLIPPESLTEGPQAAVDRYQSGASALLMTGPNFLTSVRENAPALYRQTDVAPQFPAQAAMTDFATMTLAIPKRSAHPRLALELALWMTRPAHQLALSERAPVLPSSAVALKDARFQTLRATDLAERARSVSARQLLDARAAYQIRPQQKAINEAVDWRVQQALLGTMDPTAAMARAQADVNAILKGR